MVEIFVTSPSTSPPPQSDVYYRVQDDNLLQVPHRLPKNARTTCSGGSPGVIDAYGTICCADSLSAPNDYPVVDPDEVYGAYGSNVFRSKPSRVSDSSGLDIPLEDVYKTIPGLNLLED